LQQRYDFASWVGLTASRCLKRRREELHRHGPPPSFIDARSACFDGVASANRLSILSRRIDSHSLHRQQKSMRHRHRVGQMRSQTADD
jgi:hypothetical protein